MGSMKVNVNLAMRARDVSRPRPEHIAEAAAREESVPPRVRPAPAIQPLFSPRNNPERFSPRNDPERFSPRSDPERFSPRGAPGRSTLPRAAEPGQGPEPEPEPAPEGRTRRRRRRR